MTEAEMKKAGMKPSEQNELDVMLFDMEKVYLKLFKFNWFTETFFIALQAVIVIACLIAFIYELSGHLQYTFMGICIYIGVAWGFIQGLFSFYKYVKNEKHLYESKKQITKEHLERKERMEKYKLSLGGKKIG